MIEITSETINSAIVNKSINIINLIKAGFVYTDETICTFNSMIILKDLFDNKCSALNDSIENIHFIGYKLLT